MIVLTLGSKPRNGSAFIQNKNQRLKKGLGSPVCPRGPTSYNPQVTDLQPHSLCYFSERWAFSRVRGLALAVSTVANTPPPSCLANGLSSSSLATCFLLSSLYRTLAASPHALPSCDVVYRF